MRTRKLDRIEIRVLGALLEKEQTTPAAYPLTVNALVSATNQRSNREPVMELTEGEVYEALDRLREEVLVWRSEGARSERWEHRLDRRWHLDPAAKAIVTLLLLRGPQTPGELRARSERMHSFEKVDEVTRILGRLTAEPDPLVRELPRQPGHKENRWTHVVAAQDEQPAPAPRETPSRNDRPPAAAPSAGTTASPAPPTARDDPAVEERLARLEARVEELAGKLAALAELLGEEGG